MKKIHLIPLILTLGSMALSGAEFRSVFVYNQDLSLANQGKPQYWRASNRDWPGELQLKQDPDGSRFIAITPLPSPTQKNRSGAPAKLAMVDQGTRFLGGRGMTVRISFQFRVHDLSSGAPGSYCQVQGKVSRGSRVAFATLRGFAPKPGEWTRYSSVKKLSGKLLPEEECSLSFCISGGRVDIKDLKIELESVK